MRPQIAPSRTLIAAGVLLLFLAGIAFGASFLTGKISQSIQNQQSEKIRPTVTPKEKSIYHDLPESFPRDMPLLQDGKVTVGKEDNDQWVVVYSVVSPVEKVEAYYKAELPKEGWVITSKSQAAGLTIIYARKDQKKGIVVIGKGDLGIIVSITILKNS